MFPLFRLVSTSPNKAKLLSAVALGAFISANISVASADDTREEIRQLKAEIKRLEEKVAKEEQQVRGIAKFPKMPPAATVPVVCKDAPCPPAPPPVFVSFANGLKVESWDGAFSFKIGGRIFIDGGVNSQPVQAFAGFPATGTGSFFRPYFPSHSGTGYANQVGFRQIRLEVEGKAWYEWLYKLQYDFAGSPNGLVQGGIRDMWIAWQPHYLQPIAPITIQFGNQFEPTSNEGMASSKYRDFIERATVDDLFRGNRHIGLAAETGGENVWGLYGNPEWSFKGGIFSTSWEDGNPLNPFAATTTVGGTTVVNSFNAGIPAGNSNLLNPVAGGHQYWEAAARLTYAPIHDQEHLLHFGGWVRYQNPNDATAANDNRVLQPGSTLASEANILNESLLGTQPLTCWALPTAQLVGTNCVKNVLFYGAELEAAWGPFSIQGEYIGVHYNRDPNIIVWQGAPGAASVNFEGFYLYATWYLTGESRSEQYTSYEDFDKPGNGNGAQIKILNPWSAGGWGAWEVATRVSEINLNSGGSFIPPIALPVGTVANIQGGRETDFTLGLNWYPDKGIRLMFNWVDVFQYSANYSRPDLNGIHPQLFLVRAQVDW